MPTDVVMPQMGESIFEGTITKWLKKPGDAVQRDEPLFEISTDKVDAEIPVARRRRAVGDQGAGRGGADRADQHGVVAGDWGVRWRNCCAGERGSACAGRLARSPAAPEKTSGAAAAPAAAGPATEVVMPQMGESIFEGTITKWLKQVGEAVERDEPLFEISTDKVDAEIPSPVAGTLTEDQGAGGCDGADQYCRRL